MGRSLGDRESWLRSRSRMGRRHAWEVENAGIVAEREESCRGTETCRWEKGMVAS